MDSKASTNESYTTGKTINVKMRSVAHLSLDRMDGIPRRGVKRKHQSDEEPQQEYMFDLERKTIIRKCRHVFQRTSGYKFREIFLMTNAYNRVKNDLEQKNVDFENYVTEVLKDMEDSIQVLSKVPLPDISTFINPPSPPIDVALSRIESQRRGYGDSSDVSGLGSSHNDLFSSELPTTDQDHSFIETEESPLAFSYSSHLNASVPSSSLDHNLMHLSFEADASLCQSSDVGYSASSILNSLSAPSWTDASLCQSSDGGYSASSVLDSLSAPSADDAMASGWEMPSASEAGDSISNLSQELVTSFSNAELMEILHSLTVGQDADSASLNVGQVTDSASSFTPSPCQPSACLAPVVNS